ncbi:MAG: hypothetical protein N3D12_01875 [Candidatus Methanomethyliaceae archaeon]|nr:hypothetical protein [Candidatus Methanomethyliaceae archaeon]
MPDKEVSLKVVNIAGDEGVFNPTDLSYIGAKAGELVELYTPSRAWTVKAKADSSVAVGTALIGKAVAERLEVDDGAVARVAWTKQVIEEKYEPPP